MNSKRVIRVTGKSRIKVKPDTVRLTITLRGTYFEYGEALRRSALATGYLRETLSMCGFERDDLRTLNFDINTEYEQYKENDEYRRRFVGYRYAHVLKVEFASDNKILGGVLHALVNCQLNPEIGISYVIKDPEPAKNQLLGEAVKDAESKAKVLSSAAGLSLKEIQNIDYSWGEINVEFYPMSDSLMAPRYCTSKESYDYDVEPDDIDLTDTVTVVWEIG